MATLTPKRRRRSRFPWGRIVRIVLVTVGVSALVAAGAFAYITGTSERFVYFADYLPRTEPAFPNDEEFFKYGSIGNEARAGLPVKVWAVLPKTCESLIGPKGYRKFGFVYEPGKDFPIGFSRVNVGGIEQMAINCSVCHVQTYKLTPQGKTEIFVGGAANTLDGQSYQRFLFACAATRGFDTDPVLAAIKNGFPETPWTEMQMYRLLLPVIRNALLDEAARFSWTWRNPIWGPGRVDPFNPPKFDYLEQPIDDTIGNSDMMPPWNARMKEKIQKDRGSLTYWHWDGLSSDLREVIVNSALGDQTTRRGYSKEMVDRLYAYLQALKSPKAPVTIDSAVFAKGKAVFDRLCATCHAPNGERVMTLIPAAEIGTDDNRLKMWTQAANDKYNTYDGRFTDKNGHTYNLPWVLDKFAKNNAYLAQPLNGVWLTGPYLHNGSVPTLHDLLKPPAERPVTYVRGSIVLDFKKGGYETPPCDPVTHSGDGFCYDTRLAGNTNGGHDYGTSALAEADRLALVQYLLAL